MGIGSGRVWSVYTSAAAAPACCAKRSFCSKVQTPRRIRAMAPRRLLAGSVPQASPLPSSVATSITGAVIGPEDRVPDPGLAIYDAPFERLADAAKIRSLSDAPTEIADWAVPGDATVA